MTIKVVFFANIREVLGTPEIALDLPSEARVSDLISLVRNQFGDAADILVAENTRIAVDQELITGDPLLEAAGEVAFFPPVTGG